MDADLLLHVRFCDARYLSDILASIMVMSPFLQEYEKGDGSVRSRERLVSDGRILCGSCW